MIISKEYRIEYTGKNGDECRIDGLVDDKFAKKRFTSLVKRFTPIKLIEIVKSEEIILEVK